MKLIQYFVLHDEIDIPDKIYIWSDLFVSWAIKSKQKKNSPKNHSNVTTFSRLQNKSFAQIKKKNNNNFFLCVICVAMCVSNGSMDGCTHFFHSSNNNSNHNNAGFSLVKWPIQQAAMCVYKLYARIMAPL